MIMTRADSLLPLAKVTDRLRVSGHGYVGVRSIPLDKIIGSVDRASEFHRDFHPQRRDSEARMRKLEAAFPDGDFPAISVFEVGGAYFVSDGHHRVALAHQRGQEFIEAEVVQLATNYRLSPDVDIPQLADTELRRALHEAGLSCPHEEATEAGSFLWLYQRRRALWMRGARATYRDAVYDIRHARKPSRRERRALRRAAAGLETGQTPEPVTS